jgi:hypothetical protein
MDYFKLWFYPLIEKCKSCHFSSKLLEQNMHTTIESWFVAIYAYLTGNSLKKIKQLLSLLRNRFLLYLIGNKNLLDMGDDRNTQTYFKYLEDAWTIQTVFLKLAKN